MAKRVADQQLTKDGTMSDEDVFTVGSQIGGPQRATAAQMAQRRLAKPRGGRRPGALRPPASPSPAISAPQQQNSGLNGTQQQGGFTFGQQPNGFQSNQNSSSFPPYPSNSFNPPFTTPSTGFSFSASQAQEVNNPFTNTNAHNAPPPEQTGFQGSIFNIPPQKMSSFQKPLEGGQKPLFAPGAPEISTASQSEPLSNLFNQSTNHQQPGQSSDVIFSQPNTEQQPSKSVFGRPTDQNPSQPTTDVFAHLKAPQNPTSSNPFAASIAEFQQSHSTQPTANLFAHVGPPQPSSNFFAQGSTSPTQGGGSMMQTSPDPSPQSRPFSFLNQPNSQVQTSPTKTSTGRSGGGSLFDAMSKPLAAEVSREPQVSQDKDTAAQRSGGSLFDRISKPSSEVDATTTTSTTNNSNLFSMPQSLSTPQVSNQNGLASPVKSSERNIAKPMLFQAPPEEARPSYKGVSSDLKMPATSQASISPATSGIPAVSQPSPHQFKGNFASPSGDNSVKVTPSISSQHSIGGPKNMPGAHRKFGPPPAPEDYIEEEARKWIQDWWISFYVRHKEKRIQNAERQCDERIMAIQDGLDPSEQNAASKHKYALGSYGGEEDGKQRETARVEDLSAFSQEARGVPLNGNGSYQSPSKSDTLHQQVSDKNNKRSAEEDPNRDGAQGIADNDEKSRGHDTVLYPSLSAAAPGSQTSNMFKNILGKKEAANANGIPNNKTAPLFHFAAASQTSSNQSSPNKPSSTGSAPLWSQSKSESTPRPSSGTFSPVPSTSKSSLFVNQQNSSNGAQAVAPALTFKPTVPPAGPSMGPGPGPFSFKPPTSSKSSSDVTKASAVQSSHGGITSIESSSAPSSTKPIADGQTPSADAKAPAFKFPTFSSTASSFSTSNSNPFSIQPSRARLNSSQAGAAPMFKVPNFGPAASSTNFISQFGKAAAKTAAEEKKKRKAADYDSDEEDLASWERRDAEEQQLKKQKLEEEIKGKAAKLVDGKWIITADNEIPGIGAKQAKPADSNISVLSQQHAPLTNGSNIFGRLSAEDSGAESSKTGDADDEDDENEQDDETNGQRQVRGPFDYDESGSEPDDDSEGQTNGPKALSNPFGASENGLYASPSRNDHGTRTTEKANGEDSGRSIFDRISRDEDGKPIREIPPADSQEASQPSNVLGQSFKSVSSGNLFSQPSNAASSFSSTNSKTGDSPKGDHTWKPDSPIRFGGSSNPPEVNVTSPSPSKPNFSGLFGASKPNVTTEVPTKPTSNVFSTLPTKTPNVGFSFGLKPTTTSLAPPSNNGSDATSRATSPGATTGESANESNADGEDDKAEKQEQIDLTSSGPGEEDEDVVLQVKAKALKWDTASSAWASKGVGPLRVLKNRESHLTRVLLRQDPSGRIVLNFALSKSFTYESSQSKTVRVPFVGEGGKIETWMMRVGNDEDAKKLANSLEENKT